MIPIKVTGGTITKKCSCPTQTRCPHGWTLRYWAAGKQWEETFRDLPGKPGSGKTLAKDRALKIAHDKRSGDVTFTAKGEVPFTDYCADWINRSPTRRESTKVIYRATLKRIARSSKDGP